MMNRQREKSSSGWPNGLTLIEVVVGTALAGTLLVTALLAASTHRRQIRQAEQKQFAVEAIDRLLTAWADQGFSREHLRLAIEESKSRMRDNEVSGQTPKSIRLRVVRRPAATEPDFKLEVVRVEAYVGKATRPISWLEVARARTEKPR